MGKAEDVQAKLDEIKLRTAEIQLQKAEMELEQTQESVALWKGQRDQRSRNNAQRQAQLSRDRLAAAQTAKQCTHRQGGEVGRNKPRYGKGHSVLTVVVMPDGKTQLIMCSICTLRVFSPNEIDKSKKPRNGETKEQAEIRAEKYERDREEFEKLLAHSQEKLTSEASQPMHCGVTFNFTDGEGRECFVPRPCDSYAQGLDNRQFTR